MTTTRFRFILPAGFTATQTLPPGSPISGGAKRKYRAFPQRSLRLAFVTWPAVSTEPVLEHR